MELQFHKTEYPYLRNILSQSQTQEQTLEIKLSDGMPEIGRVLLSWGQPVLRSKEWRNDGAQVTGGVMAWVLYQPEDGSMPRTVEGWIPFQLRWDFPADQQDGLLIVQPALRHIEARCISARKLMLRADIAAKLQALRPDALELSVPTDVPEQVQVLKKAYSVQMVTEAGEKAFLIDEDLQPPEDMEQILYYTLQPSIHDHKVIADKVVFRGTAQLHALYISTDGRISVWEQDMPFSQFAELDREYTQAAAKVIPVVTSVEMDKADQSGVRLKASLTGQYVVNSEKDLELIEDAYCPGKKTCIQTNTVMLPVYQETALQQTTAQASVEGDVLDVNFLPGVPCTKGQNADLSGRFQVLYRDEEGSLQGDTMRWAAELPLSATDVSGLSLEGQGRPQIITNMARAELLLEVECENSEEKKIVTGLTAEDMPEDLNRPSLILRRMGTDSLWEIARECDSTVDRIMEANGLQELPPKDKMLLIPVVS